MVIFFLIILNLELWFHFFFGCPISVFKLVTGVDQTSSRKFSSFRFDWCISTFGDFPGFQGIFGYFWLPVAMQLWINIGTSLRKCCVVVKYIRVAETVKLRRSDTKVRPFRNDVEDDQAVVAFCFRFGFGARSLWLPEAIGVVRWSFRTAVDLADPRRMVPAPASGRRGSIQPFSR